MATFESATPAPSALQPRVVVALGITQIISWGTLYYTFSLLLDPLQAELNASRSTIAGSFSVALLAGGIAAPWVGRRIDRIGGRSVMTLGSAAGGLLLAALAQVQGLAGLYAVCVGLGLAMAATLYEPAFAVVTRAYPTDYRRAITWLTLFGGFASTVFWPLTTALIEGFGWREALAVLAAINLLVCVPLHAWVLRNAGDPGAPTEPAAAASLEQARDSELARALRSASFYLLAAAFLFHLVVISAVALHLIVLLMTKGLSAGEAALIGALIGPMQVAGRLLELWFAHRWRASRLGLMAVTLMPLALLLLSTSSAFVGLVFFAALYGVSNGTMTIVRGAVPAELFGRASYGAISGLLATPGLLARAGGPFIGALLWTLGADGRWVAPTLAVLSLLAALLYVTALRLARAL